MEHTLDQQKMESAQALASMNMEVSAVKAKLISLQREEADYLVEREKKAQEKIDQLLTDSEEMLNASSRNYDEVKQYADSLAYVAKTISQTYEDLADTLEKFYERSDEWDKAVEKQHEDFAEKTRELKVFSVKLENERVGLQNKAKQLENWELKLKDERGTLDRAIQRLKQGKI